MQSTLESERKYLSELLEYHLNNLKTDYYNGITPPFCTNDLGLPDDITIQDPVL